MGSIVTTYSSVANYINDTSSEYSAISVRANETRSHVEKLNYEVQTDLDSISRQIMRGKRMLDEIQLKENKYKALMEEAAAEVDRCNEQIDYILSHPISRTYTDEDGNEYTVEEIDEVALAAARSARDRAVAEYEHYRDKYEEAIFVKYEVSATVNGFETIKSGIEKIEQLIQGYLYDIKKYISAIESESEYNIQSLNSISDSVGAYLASKAITMPSRVAPHSFESNSSFGSMGGTASGGALLSEAAADKVTHDEEGSTQVEVTPYDSASDPQNVSEKYFNKQSNRDFNSLSESEKKNLKIYCDDYDHNPLFKNAYGQINNHLRFKHAITDSMLRTMNIMTGAISKHTLKRDTTLYRGIDQSGVEKIFGKLKGRSINEINDMLGGQTFIERGFSSTSISMEDAFKYCNYNGIMFKITAPTGTEGIFTKDISGFSASEHEVLLQRGLVYRINAIKDMRDYYEMDITIIGRMNIQ